MRKLEVRSCFGRKLVKEYSVLSFAEAGGRAELAVEAQRCWVDVPLERRVELVRNALGYFEDNRDAIAKDISLQMGRPLHQARGEIFGLLDRARYMCSVAQRTLAPEIIEDSEKFYRAIEHVPLGVVFVISAWNYPLLITINSLVPALIAGNTVLLKHSSLTPEIGFHFAKAFGQLGGVENLVQNLIVDHQTTGQIIEQLPINHVVFTGSVSGGQQILSHTAKRFMMPQLELGGKDGAYVDKSADVVHAAESIVDGAMFNSGQSCCGIERAYVHEAVYDRFIEKTKALIEAYVLGDPLDSKTSLGPQANPGAIDHMLTQVEDAKSKGARVLLGGEDLAISNARFMKPTLVVDVNHTMDIVKEENFGPILPVIKVNSMQEAVGFINDSEYGLTCAIFTNDVDQAKDFSHQVNTGTVFMNRCDYLDPALPWTGVKNSGCGSALSKYGYYGLTRRKAIHFKKN